MDFAKGGLMQLHVQAFLLALVPSPDLIHLFFHIFHSCPVPYAIHMYSRIPLNGILGTRQVQDYQIFWIIRHYLPKILQVIFFVTLQPATTECAYISYFQFIIKVLSLLSYPSEHIAVYHIIQYLVQLR